MNQGNVKIPEIFFGNNVYLLQENDISVTCSTRHADFDELFRILKFQFFLRYFGILSSWEFSGILTPTFRHFYARVNFPGFLRSQNKKI